MSGPKALCPSGSAKNLGENSAVYWSGEKMLFFTTELHKNQWSQKQRFVQVEIPLCICIIFIIQQTREKLEMEGEAELA